jgi:hypothetical protein
MTVHGPDDVMLGDTLLGDIELDIVATPAQVTIDLVPEGGAQIDLNIPAVAGPPGPTGPQGPPGSGSGSGGGTTILSGVAAPTPEIGVTGDFYLDTDDHTLYGPKSGTDWPVAIQQGGVGGGVFEQSFATASTTWVVTHSLHTRAVEVNCYAPNGIDEIDAEVDVVGADQVIVRWYYPTTGVVRVMA